MSTAAITIERLAYRLLDLPGIGVATLRKILANIRLRGVSPEEFASLDVQTLVIKYALSEAAAQQVRCGSPCESETLEKLNDHGVKVLVLGGNGYPVRLNALLGDKAPPLLFVKGAVDLLSAPGVGFCGSRNASEQGLGVARECARLLAAKQINIVSGYAHGVDIAAHCGALDAGGSTTIVLSEGIFHFRMKERVSECLNGNDMTKMVVVSEFPPNLPWKSHNAMTRNRTICGLANALVVVESGMAGGTFEAGKTALALKEPLFCVEYADPGESATGNAWLVEHGAIPLRRNRLGQPNLTAILEAVSRQSLPQGTGGYQQSELLPNTSAHG